MSKYQRTKGHNWEREVSIDLRKYGFSDAKRHLEYQEGEAFGVDIVNTGDFKVQCKSMAKVPNIPKVFSEFIKLKEDDIPVIAFKVTGKGEYACFKWEDALILMAWREMIAKKAFVTQ